MAAAAVTKIVLSFYHLFQQTLTVLLLKYTNYFTPLN